MFFRIFCLVYVELVWFFIDDAFSVVQDMLSHFFFVPAHKFPIGPDSVLRTIDLIHDESHQKIHKGVNESIDLVGSIGGSKEFDPDVGAKIHGE
jgi:hypothetical protein